MTYQEFLDQKKHNSVDYGIECNYLPEKGFDFQRHVIEYAVKKGRCALFLDTGLGKTLIELSIALNYRKHTGKPVLIITPLAVAYQFVNEAKKFGITGVQYSKDGSYDTDIVVCNYERLGKFIASDFDCVILDESSILKNFEGAIKNQVTAFLKKVKYRFLATATPSPNDYIELGTSSEALGYMGYMDMLGKYFKNNSNNVAKISQVDKARKGMKFYLKPHAEQDFWAWVSSWSISLKKPSDLGYSDDKYKLPKLHERKNVLRNENPLAIDNQHQLFAMPAMSFKEIKAEVRATIDQRCGMAYDLAKQYDSSVYWVNLNDEAALMSKLDKDAVEVNGSMTIDQKEDILISFGKGEIKKLITKTSITAFGLNWQHCNHTTYFPTYSYEQYYQAIRRFYRFGQKRDVYVDLVLSDGQVQIMETLMAKKNQASTMFDNLINNTGKFQDTKKEYNKQIIQPSW